MQNAITHIAARNAIATPTPMPASAPVDSEPEELSEDAAEVSFAAGEVDFAVFEAGEARIGAEVGWNNDKSAERQTTVRGDWYAY